MLERRKLGQIPLENEERLWIRVSEPLDLLEQSLADERVEEVRQGLAFDPHGSQDVVARGDLLDVDGHAEFTQSVRDVLRFVRVDDERNAHESTDSPERRKRSGEMGVSRVSQTVGTHPFYVPSRPPMVWREGTR